MAVEEPGNPGQSLTFFESATGKVLGSVPLSDHANVFRGYWHDHPAIVTAEHTGPQETAKFTAYDAQARKIGEVAGQLDPAAKGPLGYTNGYLITPSGLAGALNPAICGPGRAIGRCTDVAVVLGDAVAVEDAGNGPRGYDLATGTPRWTVNDLQKPAGASSLAPLVFAYGRNLVGPLPADLQGKLLVHWANGPMMSVYDPLTGAHIRDLPAGESSGILLLGPDGNTAVELSPDTSGSLTLDAYSGAVPNALDLDKGPRSWTRYTTERGVQQPVVGLRFVYGMNRAPIAIDLTTGKDAAIGSTPVRAVSRDGHVLVTGAPADATTWWVFDPA
ncbi:hypothetical protein [Yinghuangia seranimata]|uniref:hypothetical protein n=1 Tax=Yinghuangia seranimata TaxID=408067 RepID=UPI00248AF119|nr:hypothetical protein [Yinghuangia seranimata]MDI2130565.1 hypothetical protein [Yinghuangia seranimata]